MKNIRLILVVGTILCCAVTNAQYILNLDLVQMTPYLGKSCKVRITEISTGREVGRKTIAEITSATFSVELYTLLHGRSYNVDIVVDVNGNGMYDAPPVDHAWRRMVTNATMHTNMSFFPDANFTDTGCPDAFPFSQYDATWGGKWFNLTFGSTDSIKASFRITCDSIFGFFMTKGVFGNPETVMFNFAEAIPEDAEPTDTIKFSLPAPWTGQVCIIQDRIEADLALMGLQLQFTGTVGAKQILCLYEVLTGGNPFANGYFYVRELTINSSAPELTMECAMSNVRCNGAMDGSASVTPAGGTPDYTYAWSNGATTPSVSGLGPGEYSVTVTDASGCTATKSVTITEPPPLTLITFVTNVKCHGICEGRLSAGSLGGTPPYVDYTWSDGFEFAVRDSVCAGEYTVTVTDAAGCTASETYTITQPDPIVIQVVAQVNESNGQGNGDIDVTVTGGVPPYFYSWSKEGVLFSNEADIANLNAGVYHLTVVDANLCVVGSGNIEIQNISGVNELDAYFRLYPNPISSQMNIMSDISLSVEVQDVHGNTLISAEEALSHQISMKELAAGMYVVVVSDGSRSSVRKLMKIE
jgi:hypothetical protein